VIFVIRTRRHPFWRSRPSRPLLITSLLVPLIGIALPYTALSSKLGFEPLPAVYLPILIVFIAAYLTLVEVAKGAFYKRHLEGAPLARPRSRHERRVGRRAARFSRRHALGARIAPSH
jgi:Mg2+-importing ATPase